MVLSKYHFYFYILYNVKVNGGICMIKKIIKAFYPEVCPNCNAVVREVGLCKDCKDAFRLIEEPFCAVCGRPVGSESIYMCDDCKTTKHYFKRNVSTFE